MNTRLKPFLWTGTGDPPAEYNTYKLCQFFHCLPSELRAESFRDVYSLIACINAEVEVKELKDKPGLDTGLRGTGRG